MFSERLKILRSQAGMSQKELAERLFVSQQSVAKWETDKSTPNPEMVARIAEVFGVPSDYLLGISDVQSPSLPYDPETVAAMEDAFERPEMRALFSVSKNATKEDIEKTIAILKTIKGDDYAE